MSIPSLRGAVEWALMVGLVLGAGAIAQAQEDEAEQPDGRVIQIGRADTEQSKQLPPPENGEASVPNQPGFPELQQNLPKYWIGLRGAQIHADHPLRAHIDLPQGQGLLVDDIVPDSPAAKAGLKRHDILLRANDAELRDMDDLVELVGTEGEKKAQITLEILRHGERETVYLTPEERPANAGLSQGGEGGLGGGMALPEGIPGEILKQFESRGLPFEFRNLGPGVILGDGRGPVSMPNGVTVKVQKNDGQPTQITVQRGDETWEVTGDDAESLKKLPDDVRPFVEQMLHGGAAPGMNLQLPNIDLQGRGPAFNDERLRNRLEKMERRLEELQQRFSAPNDQPENQPVEHNEAH